VADNTPIEWTDATWNPSRGCTRVSEGCRHCYAEGIAARFSEPGQPFHKFADRDRPGSKWTGKVAIAQNVLLTPTRWRVPRRIFVNSMSDLFHEDLPDADIDRVFAVMALSPQHIFQVLTKRAARMRAWFEERWLPARAHTVQFAGQDIMQIPAQTHGETRHDQVLLAAERIMQAWPDAVANRHYTPAGQSVAVAAGWPLPNVWVGVSVESQAEADRRIPDLMATPAAVHFLSCEPLLELVRVPSYWLRYAHRDRRAHPKAYPDRRIDWVIVGGESGVGARPMDIEWARSLHDQCRAANVPYFMKQMGGAVKARMPPIPADLLVRQFPPSQPGAAA
jgi:protein gp37